MADLRRCSKCRYKKLIKHFGRDGNHRDGLRSWCNKCRAIFESPRYRIARHIALKRWRRLNRVATNAQVKRARWRRKLEFIKAYGGKCGCCGERTSIFLTLEHKNGNGAFDRAYHGGRGNDKIYALLKKDGWPKKDHALLCFNCNIGSSLNGGECPHKAGVKCGQI